MNAVYFLLLAFLLRVETKKSHHQSHGHNHHHPPHPHHKGNERKQGSHGKHKTTKQDNITATTHSLTPSIETTTSSHEKLDLTTTATAFNHPTSPPMDEKIASGTKHEPFETSSHEISHHVEDSAPVDEPDKASGGKFQKMKKMFSGGTSNAEDSENGDSSGKGALAMSLIEKGFKKKDKKDKEDKEDKGDDVETEPSTTENPEDDHQETTTTIVENGTNINTMNNSEKADN